MIRRIRCLLLASLALSHFPSRRLHSAPRLAHVLAHPEHSPCNVQHQVRSRTLHCGCPHATPRCRYCLGRPTPSQVPPRVSLMALGRIALELVDEPGLGRAEGEPVAPGLLQPDEELPTALHRLLVEVVPALELDLERKLAAQWMVRAPLAPDGDVGFQIVIEQF